MSTKIRLARGGSKKRPFYRVVVADSRSPRDGKFIEKIGTYNPLLSKDNAERVVLKQERVEYWLGQGAEVSERISVFLKDAGIGQKFKQVERINTKRAEVIKLKSAEIAAKKKAEAEAKKAAEEEAKKEAEEAAKAEAEAKKAEEAAAKEQEEAKAEEPKAEEVAEEKPAEEAKAEEEKSE